MNKFEMQWEELLSIITKHVSEPRRGKLIAMYERFADRICTAPASSHTTRHNCFPGGYLDHILRVVHCAEHLYGTWKAAGADVNSFTYEELIFSALNHDLGKIGSSLEEYYIPNDSKWHIERGQVYKINPKLQFMKVPDRSIFLLQEYNIPFSENEYLAIKLHDGLYAKGNESYYMSTMPEFELKTCLPILLHHADHLASLIEHSNTHQGHMQQTTKPKTKMTMINDPIADDNLKSMFDKIFND